MKAGRCKRTTARKAWQATAAALAAAVSVGCLVFEWSGRVKTVHIVRIGGSGAPVYPELCPICGRATGEPLVSYSLNTAYGDEEDARLDYLLYGIRKRVYKGKPFRGIVAHHRCMRSVQFRLLKLVFLLLIACASTYALASAVGLPWWAGAAAAIILGTGLFGAILRIPLPVEYYSYEDHDVFSFISRDYAEKFAGENGSVAEEVVYPQSYPRTFVKYDETGKRKEHGRDSKD